MCPVLALLLSGLGTSGTFWNLNSSVGCHPIISSSVIPFTSCLQSFLASGSFPISWMTSLMLLFHLVFLLTSVLNSLRAEVLCYLHFCIILSILCCVVHIVADTIFSKWITMKEYFWCHSVTRHQETLGRFPSRSQPSSYHYKDL